MNKVKAIYIIVILILAGCVVSGAVNEYFTRHTSTITSQKIILWDNESVEHNLSNDSFILNASEIIEVNHTIKYIGKSTSYGILFIWTGDKGITSHVVYDNNLTNMLILKPDIEYNITLRYTADYNLSSGMYQTTLTIAPTPLKNPTYDEMLNFLFKDQTDKHSYIQGLYMCSNFTDDLIFNATKEGLRCGFTVIKYSDEKGHAIVAFDTIDFGIIYIEPQTDGRMYPSKMQGVIGWYTIW